MRMAARACASAGPVRNEVRRAWRSQASMGLLDGKRIVDHRRPHRRLDRLRRGQAGPGGGRRDRADRRRPGPVAHRAHRPQAAAPAPRASSSTSPTPTHVAAVRDEPWPTRWDRVDGVLHAIGFAPAVVPRRRRSWTRPWEDVAVALHVSAYSLKALADAVRAADDRRAARSSGLDFDATRGLAGLRLDGRGQGGARVDRRATWPATSGARGIRVNLVAAGPIRTMAAKSIPGFSAFEDVWDDRAPLGWDVNDPDRRSPRPASPCCRTGSPPPPARSSTSTAATTPSAPEPASSRTDAVRDLCDTSRAPFATPLELLGVRVSGSCDKFQAAGPSRALVT